MSNLLVAETDVHHVSDARFASVERYSSVAGTVEILSDSWGFLVLRECFFGIRRFDQFQNILQIPRTTLDERLKKFTTLGILKKQLPTRGGARHEYRFTDKGRDLYPTMIALLAFGDRWLAGDAPAPLRLIHSACNCECAPKVVCSHCHTALDPRDVRYRDGPGAASVHLVGERKRSRRTSDTGILERVRPCSVARTLQIIGDRWSFLVIREFFYGVRRFDEFQSRLGIATNILTDRLQRIVEQGLAEKHLYQERPKRFEYRLTAMGRDLYGSMLVMMAWGDRWLSGGKAPLKLRHGHCDHDFHAIVVCDKCDNELDPRQMGYVARYTLPTMLSTSEA